MYKKTGRSSAWLEHLLWEQGVARSNRVIPTNRMNNYIRNAYITWAKYRTFMPHVQDHINWIYENNYLTGDIVKDLYSMDNILDRTIYMTLVHFGYFDTKKIEYK